jgi:hypothetical protein
MLSQLLVNGKEKLKIMNRITVFSLTVALAMVISACGAEATPTVNPVDIQNTAIAAAFTVVAETQAAIPTNTPIPPTETPSPTPLPTQTPISLPTLEVPPTTAPTSGSSGGDPCNAPLGATVSGKPTTIKLVNQTKGPIIASLYLNLTPFGECGFRGYNLSKGDSVVITDLPQGCYNVSVFVNDPKNPSKSFGYGCINNSDKWTFDVFPESVKFTGP